MSEAIEIVRGSGSVDRDWVTRMLKLDTLRAELAAGIIGSLRERKLTQRQTADFTGLAQPNICRIKNAVLRGLLSIGGSRG